MSGPKDEAHLSGAPHLAAAAALIAAALGISDGNLDPLSLVLVTLAAALCAVALVRSRPLAAESRARSERAASAVLGAGIAVGAAFDALYLPGLTVDPARLGGFRPVLGAAALAVATHLWPRPPAALFRLRFPFVLAAWVVLAAIVLRASPAPGIDVWRIQQAGALAFADGLNPYALAYPNPYGPGTEFLAKEVLTPDGRYIRAFPYPPLVLLLGVPSALLGDVRLGYVLATAGAALLAFLIGRRARTAELAATLLLFQPRTLMVMELSWTEPTVLVALCALALLVRRAAAAPLADAGWSGWPVLGVAVGLVLAAKQYAPLLVLPFWLAVPARHRWRVAGVATAVAAAVYAPFLAWDPPALWRGVVEFQLAQPFRTDALSWPAAVVAWGGPQLPPWPAFAAAAAVAVLGARRVRSASDALAAGALAWLVLVLGNKQAFCNYYWLAAGVLCAAVAARAGEPGPPDETSRGGA